ncbi:MAG: hypothetical protein R3D60_07605 [Paracoccaceae bacterium]
MNIQNQTATLHAQLAASTGRFTDKTFDWKAFPSNIGFPELERAQMRYIGAGGSPKVGDTSTLKAENFTLSLIYKEPGRYAACHSHEIEESFLILSGALIVGWEKDGEVVEVNLGPKDMILNAREVAHGFRVDGVEPVMMSISVDVGKPLPPVYRYHPKDCPAELARSFGAEPGKTIRFDRNGTHPLQQLMADFVVRHAELPTIWEDAGFTRKVYVGSARAPCTTTPAARKCGAYPRVPAWPPSPDRSKMRSCALKARSRWSGSMPMAPKPRSNLGRATWCARLLAKPMRSATTARARPPSGP